MTLLLLVKAIATREFGKLFALTIREIVEIANKTIERCKTSVFRRYIDCEFRLSIVNFKERFGALIVVKTVQLEVLKVAIDIPAVYILN